MTRTPRLIVAGAIAVLLTVGVAPATAGANDHVDPVDDTAVDEALTAEAGDPSGGPTVEPPHRGLIVFSADARIDGRRVPDEIFLALGYDDRYPFWASLWLLTDAEDDEWVPICIGYLFGDDDRAMFVGGSTIGDDGDGCVVVPLGDEDDDGNVAFGAVELEGDSVATAAMYAIG